MKRILVALSLVVAVFTMSAQSYRGFIDLYGGVATGSGHTVETGVGPFSDVKPNYGFGLSTSHGCQITPWGFVGVGVGAYATIDHAAANGDTNNEDSNGLYGIYIPISLDLRWDLNIRKKVTPFVDLKIGYQLAVDGSDDEYGEGELWGDGHIRYLHFESLPGFYFQPTIGVRFRMGKKSGFNLGVTYNPTVKKRVYAFNRDGGSHIDEKDFTSGVAMINLGFDF